ncbi:5271_t:CDS:2, partial [Ambispora leptoticha]
GHFLDTFTSNKQYQYIEYNDINFYEKTAKSFNDQEALKSLASVLRRNIIVISSNQANPEIYKIKDAEETIYIGLEEANKKHFKYYRSLKVLDNNLVIEKNYLSKAKEIKATEYKSDINLFERKEIKKLLEAIIKQESKEITACNLVRREDGINYFTSFFNKIKEEYEEGNKVMKNPAYMVRIGIKKPESKEKIEILECACNLDKSFSLPAHYNLAYAVIEYQKEDYQQKVVTNLSIAKDRIDEVLIPHLQYMQVLLPLGQSCELSKQKINKIEMLKTIKSNIEEIIKKCKNDSKKNIKIKKVPLEKYFNNKDLTIEIKEFENEGLQYLFDINIEIDWFGVIFLCVAGTVQIVIGIYCAIRGHTELGKSFIAEADSSSNSPDSPRSPALSALKDAGQKMAIRKTLDYLLDKSADEIINRFKEDVRENIFKELNLSLDDPAIIRYLNKLAAADELYEEELNKITTSTLEILEDKKNIFVEFIEKGLETILKSNLPILKEARENIGYKLTKHGTNLVTTVTTLHQINKISRETAKEISEVFKNKLKELCEQKVSFEIILEGKLKPKINLKDAKAIVKLLKETTVIKDEEFDKEKAQK